MPFDSQLKPKWCKHFSFNSRKRTVLWSTYVMTSLRRFSGLSTESAIPRRDPVRAGGRPSSLQAMGDGQMRNTGRLFPRRPQAPWGRPGPAVHTGGPVAVCGISGRFWAASSAILSRLTRLAHLLHWARLFHLARVADASHRWRTCRTWHTWRTWRARHICAPSLPDAPCAHGASCQPGAPGAQSRSASAKCRKNHCEPTVNQQ